MKTIRDPVHNVIQFDKVKEKLLLDLIDTREFQRLRHIKQLGLSAFTYPGAEHTRFAHSLGVTHLMKRFIEKLCSLRDKKYEKHIEELKNYRLLALAAALLHDIGHGPFSHALERTTGIKHERWTIAIIEGDTEVNKVLKDHGLNPREVSDVIQRTHKSTAVVKLLSSQLDADRIDYLLRDSKMTGAGYGSFDLEWLINVLTLGEVNGVVEVGLDKEKGLSIAEDFVMARYYMYLNVYFHKTTRSAELLIDKIFNKALELHNKNNKEIEFPTDLEVILNSANNNLTNTIQNYINLTDSTIWHYITIWSKHSDEVLSDLCSRVLNRKFFKAFEPKGDLMSIYDKINETCMKKGLPRDYYFLIDEAKSSSYKDTYILNRPYVEKPGEREASEQIFLFDKEGNGEELSNMSEIIKAIRNKQISIKRFYAPEEIKEIIMGG